MTYRTAILSSIETYLACEDEPPDDLAQKELARHTLLSRFPYPVMLQLAFPELDFANLFGVN